MRTDMNKNARVETKHSEGSVSYFSMPPSTF